jgi:uncharacterized membrane protein HdeD (DUF308 family)
MNRAGNVYELPRRNGARCTGTHAGSEQRKLSTRLAQLIRVVQSSRVWWRQILLGGLAIAGGVACIVLPARILFLRIIALAVGDTRTFAGGIRALAAALGILVIVLFDGLFHFFWSPWAETRTRDRALRIAGAASIAAAIFWPDITAYIATVIVSGCALILGVLEIGLNFHRPTSSTYQALTVSTGLALMGIGIFTMQHVFVGAVLILAVAGVALAVRGVLLIGYALRTRFSKQRRIAEPPHSNPIAA